MEWRTARGQEDRARMEANVAEIRAGLVPRAEHERVWQNYMNKDQDLQRQLDEVKEAQGSVYGARDVILDLRERLDRVERQRIAAHP
jgi:C-terminal processing protease CtpA/Prc